MPPLPADSIHARACKLKCEKILTRPRDERRLTPPPLTFPRSAVIFVEKAAAACAAPALKHFCSILHHNLAFTQNLGLTQIIRNYIETPSMLLMSNILDNSIHPI